MIKIMKEIEIYNFKELKENIKQMVINSFINMIVENTNFEELNKNTNLYKAYLKCKKMQTPWFISDYVWEYDKKHILKMCNFYNYTKNGQIYCDK